MPTLADIYSAIGSARRKAGDFVANPMTSLQQMVNDANSRAGKFNELNDQALQEFKQTGKLYGPTTQQLGETLADAYNPMGMTASYKGTHLAPNAKNYGATLDDLTKVMPSDVYGANAKNLYGIGDSVIDHEWKMAALRAKGNPNAEIEIYRAVPKGVKNINSGDWVTTSKKYADWHGENALNGEYEIVKQKVKANQLSSEGYPYEFGYHEN